LAGEGERLLPEPLPFFFPPLPGEGDLPRLLSRTCSKTHESPLAHFPDFWNSKQTFSADEGDAFLAYFGIYPIELVLGLK
jgi:hypothetical protein